MKFTYYLRGAVAMLVLVSTMPSCSQAQPSQTQKLSTEMDSVSYALGVLFATNMKSEGMNEINSEALASGFSAVMNDNATIEPADADNIVREAMAAVKDKVSAAAKAEGEEFLAENAKKDGTFWSCFQSPHQRRGFEEAWSDVPGHGPLHRLDD